MRLSKRSIVLVAAGVVIGGALLARVLGGGEGPTESLPAAVASDAAVDTTSSSLPNSDGATPVVSEELPDQVSLPALDLGGAFPRTELGAREAAIFYLEGTEEAVQMSPSEAATAQRSIATANYADVFEADTEQRMLELTAAIPNGIVVRVAPVEAQSIEDGDDWLVSVWYAQAITIADETVVDDWRTVHYRMQWEGGTWKVADFRSERGPMPGRGTQPPSASPGQFEAILSGFSDEGF